MKIQIKHRYTDSVLFECKADSLKKAVEKAVKEKVDLSGSDLSYSDLSGSDLSGSDLSYSDLRGSDLSDSNLRGTDLSYSNLSDSNLRGSDLRCSDLSGSDLSGSDLSYSDLSGSDLSYSNLSGSNLSGSDLRYSDLRYSNLSGSNLRGSDLSGAKLRSIKHDVWGVLLLNKNEVPFLRSALLNGEVDGSTYTGTCSCLCGTIARAKGLNDGKSLKIADSNSLSERFFLAIKKGDTPKTNPVSKIALEWVDEFLELINGK